MEVRFVVCDQASVKGGGIKRSGVKLLEVGRNGMLYDSDGNGCEISSDENQPVQQPVLDMASRIKGR